MRAMLRPWLVLGFALAANIVMQQIGHLVAPSAGRFEWPPGLGLAGAVLGEPTGLCAAAITLASGLVAFVLLRLLRTAAPRDAVMGPIAVLAAAALALFGAVELAIAAAPGAMLAIQIPSGRKPDLAPLFVGLATLGMGLAVLFFLVRAIHRRSGAARWRIVVAILAANLACSALLGIVRAVPAETFRIPSESMIPTLVPGEIIWVDRWVPLWRQPARGEVLVTRTADGTAWVRRVVGLPGERVALAGGIVHINGVPLPRMAAGTTIDMSWGRPATVPLFREQGPEGTSWTVAEQPNAGWLGTMAETLVPAGHLFMLGDSRGNSMDSRMREVGMIPIAAVQGPAFRRITTRRDAPLLLAPPAAE